MADITKDEKLKNLQVHLEERLVNGDIDRPTFKKLLNKTEKKIYKNVQLKNLHLNKSLDEIDFANATFEDVKFVDCYFEATNFRTAFFFGVIFKNCTFKECDFFASEHTNNQVDYCEFLNCNFNFARFKKWDVNYSYIKLSNMVGMIITEAQIYKTTKAGCDLSDALIENSKLSEVSFHGADLTNLKMLNCKFANLTFTGADLTNANIQGLKLDAEKT